MKRKRVWVPRTKIIWVDQYELRQTGERVQQGVPQFHEYFYDPDGPNVGQPPTFMRMHMFHKANFLPSTDSPYTMT